LPGVRWRAIRRFEPSFTKPGHEIIRRTAQVAAEVLGEQPAVNMRVGGSDSRWYRRHGVPTAVLGLTPFNMGGPDEYVLVDELLAVAKIHTLVDYDFLSAEQCPWTGCPIPTSSPRPCPSWARPMGGQARPARRRSWASP